MLLAKSASGARPDPVDDLPLKPPRARDVSAYWRPMKRAALFALAGTASFAYWFVARPTTGMTAAMTEWPGVLAFSAVLLLLAVALPPYGRMVGGRGVARVSLVAGGGIGLASLGNVLEDGFRLEWAFLVFVAGVLTMLVALLVMSVGVIRNASGRDRLHALVPVGTVAGVAFFPWAGGPILLLTWLAAAARALAGPRMIPAPERSIGS